MFSKTYMIGNLNYINISTASLSMIFDKQMMQLVEKWI